MTQLNINAFRFALNLLVAQRTESGNEAARLHYEAMVRDNASAMEHADTIRNHAFSEAQLVRDIIAALDAATEES